MTRYKGFREVGARMLRTWNDGVDSLRESRVYGLPMWQHGPAFEALPEPPKLVARKKIIGRSEGLPNRAKKPKPKSRTARRRR